MIFEWNNKIAQISIYYHFWYFLPTLNDLQLVAKVHSRYIYNIRVYPPYQKVQEELEDSKVVIRIRKSKINRQQMAKRKKDKRTIYVWFRWMVLNATFNNISVISWRSVLLDDITGVPGGNHPPFASHWQTWSHNVASSTPRHERSSIYKQRSTTHYT